MSFQRACPRFDQNENRLGTSGLFARTVSIQPSAIIGVKQARSSGRNPEFLTFCLGRARSIGVCAMLMSPHTAIARFSFTSSPSHGKRHSRYFILITWRSADEEPLGT